MFGIDEALGSGDLHLLLWTAVGLGFLHTILGPDHYVPFAMMARAQGWSQAKTARVTFLCGLGHVGSSVVIGGVLAAVGMAATQWEGSGWAALHESRGSIAAWLLIGFGAAFTLWGIVRGARAHAHTHPHAHEDGTIHIHEHDHTGSHMHAHDTKARSITPWVLFTIFIFGPCESLIPLMLAAWAVAGLSGMALVAGAFSATTVLTILGAVAVVLAGASRIRLGRFERWSTAVAGLSLVLCGAAIAWLGL